MKSQHENRKYSPAGLGQHQRGRRSIPAADACPPAAGFLTARKTARDTERSARDTARRTPRYQPFDADMHTARGFETDDYLSAVEPSTSRSTGTLIEVQS